MVLKIPILESTSIKKILTVFLRSLHWCCNRVGFMAYWLLSWVLLWPFPCARRSWSKTPGTTSCCCWTTPNLHRRWVFGRCWSRDCPWSWACACRHYYPSRHKCAWATLEDWAGFEGKIAGKNDHGSTIQIITWFMWNWFWLQNLVWFLHPLGSDDYCIQFYSNVIPFEEQWCFCFFQVFQCWVSLVTMINMISAPKLDHFLMLPLGDWPVRCYLDAACIHLGQGELFERGIYSIAGSFSVAEEMRVLYSETPGTDWWAD